MLNSAVGWLGILVLGCIWILESFDSSPASCLYDSPELMLFLISLCTDSSKLVGLPCHFVKGHILLFLWVTVFFLICPQKKGLETLKKKMKSRNSENPLHIFVIPLAVVRWQFSPGLLLVSVGLKVHD